MDNNSTAEGPGDLIQAAILNSENYYDQELWFKLLQDDGIAFSDLDDSIWFQNSKKKKSGHITVRRMHFKQLYNLAVKIYGLYYSKKDSLFGNLLKNKSDAIHKIGTFIAASRYPIARGDIHSVSPGYDYKKFVFKEEYNTRKVFYFLDQATVLTFFLDLWSSVSKKEQMKPTNSDRLRAIGLLFSDDEMREYIPYIQSSSDRKECWLSMNGQENN